MNVREGSWQQYDWLREGDVMVPMRDGVRLATDIYRPALDGRPVRARFPALLERTPYDKRPADDLTATAQVLRPPRLRGGLQDVRGRFDSEGEWYAFANEGPDGNDAVDWLAARPCCDGQVGTIGLSYSGSDQTALACLAPEGLAAMFVVRGHVQLPHLRHAPGRCARAALPHLRLPHGDHLQGSDRATGRSRRAAPARARADCATGSRRLPLRAGQTPLRHLPTYERWVIDIAHPRRLRRLLEAARLLRRGVLRQHTPTCRVYLLGGWYDSYARSTTDIYVALSRLQARPGPA